MQRLLNIYGSRGGLPLRSRSRALGVSESLSSLLTIVDVRIDFELENASVSRETEVHIGGDCGERS